jgi:hypothetical protein
MSVLHIRSMSIIREQNRYHPHPKYMPFGWIPSVELGSPVGPWLEQLESIISTFWEVHHGHYIYVSHLPVAIMAACVQDAVMLFGDSLTQGSWEPFGLGQRLARPCSSSLIPSTPRTLACRRVRPEVGCRQ